MIVSIGRFHSLVTTADEGLVAGAEVEVVAGAGVVPAQATMVLRIKHTRIAEQINQTLLVPLITFSSFPLLCTLFQLLKALTF